MGLDQVRFCGTAAAPMPYYVLAYFGSLGIRIFDIYGMTESCGMMTMNTADYNLWGSSGRVNASSNTTFVIQCTR